MPLKCPDGSTPRYRFRNIKGKRVRLAFCDNEIIEVAEFKKGRKTILVRK